MSYKQQLFPLSDTEQTLRQHIEHLWGHSPADLTEMDLRDLQLLRSWLVYDSIVEAGAPTRRLNWNVVLGLSLATAVSASIWAGIGFAIASLLN